VKPRFTKDDVCALSEEIDSLRQIWEKTDLLAGSLRLCRGVVLGDQASGELVAHRAIFSLREGKPFSLVRIGDGEGNVLSVLEKTASLQLNLTAFNVTFHNQDRQCLSDEGARRFSANMECSVCCADILGIRSFHPWGGASFDTAEGTMALRRYEEGNFRAAHGLIHARKQVERLLQSGSLANVILTHAWVHLSLIAHLPDIIEECERLIVITGRDGLQDEFRSRFSEKKLDFYSIPLEGMLRSKTNVSHHFPEPFETMLERLNENLSGALVLVGAGIFGKAYCHAAKRQGAVALDIGSAFDILSGLKTRPVHKPEYVRRMRWLDPERR